MGCDLQNNAGVRAVHREDPGLREYPQTPALIRPFEFIPVN